MEERKRTSVTHWITPDVFCGQMEEIQDAVGQNNYVKRLFEYDQSEPKLQELEADVTLLEERISHVQNENNKTQEQIRHIQEQVSSLHELVNSMNEQVRHVFEQLTYFQTRLRELEASHAKERSHLHQMVLSLKQEWESQK